MANLTRRRTSVRAHTRKRPGRRKDDGPDVEIIVPGLIEALRNYLTSGGSWIKLALAIGTIIVLLWSAFSFDDRLAAQDRELAHTVQVVADLRGDVAGLEEDVGRIQEGVGEAARDLDQINRLLRELQQIRQELIDSVNRPRRR